MSSYLPPAELGQRVEEVTLEPYNEFVGGMGKEVGSLRQGTCNVPCSLIAVICPMFLVIMVRLKLPTV